MSNEISVQSRLQVIAGNVNYQATPTGYVDSVVSPITSIKGPTPGAFLAAKTGTSVNFSALTTPGYARLRNLDKTNPVDWGVYDPSHHRFYPVGRINPGKWVDLMLSPHLQEHYGTGTGTGTGGGGNAMQLQFRAVNAPCYVSVEAFEA